MTHTDTPTVDTSADTIAALLHDLYHSDRACALTHQAAQVIEALTAPAMEAEPVLSADGAKDFTRPLPAHPYDEQYDTQMDVERDPCGAWMAIQHMAHHLAHPQDAESLRAEAYAPDPSEDVAHIDDYAVARFAALMKAKLATSRAKGRSGWDDPSQCSPEYLRDLLYEHLDKGDPVDVANFCMMLQHYEASTARDYGNTLDRITAERDAALSRAEKVEAEVARCVFALEMHEKLWSRTASRQRKRIEEAKAEVARLVKINETWQKNSKDWWSAMQAMRNAINEHIPMQSMEADLTRGPEDSVFCEVLAEAVIRHVTGLSDALATSRAETAMAWISGRDVALSAFDKVLYGPLKEGAQTKHFRKNLHPPADATAALATRDRAEATQIVAAAQATRGKE